MPGDDQQFGGTLPIRDQQAIVFLYAQANVVLDKLSVGEQICGEIFEIDLAQTDRLDDMI